MKRIGWSIVALVAVLAFIGVAASAAGLGAGLAVDLQAGQSAAHQAASSDCAGCHPGPARDYAKGKMSAVIDCTSCHAEPHSSDRSQSMPTAATCGSCHPKQAEEFAGGKHALAWDALANVPNYHAAPESARNTGCDGCHSIGQAWSDGSKGRCNSCHGRHTFSVAEAREPEACAHCHIGDHPQYDIWSTSRHGQIYSLTRDDTRAPKCQTCHMPGGAHNSITSWGFLGLRGEEPDPVRAATTQPIIMMLKDLGPANAPNVMRATMAEWQDLRDEMTAICASCHSATFAQARLATGDQMLRDVDNVFSGIVQGAYALEKAGLLDSMRRQSVTRNALAHRFSAFMGAFHFGYEYAWDEGYLALMDDMIDLKALAGPAASAISPPAGMTLPAGVAPPAGVTIPAGITVPAGMTPPAGMTIPPGITPPATAAEPQPTKP